MAVLERTGVKVVAEGADEATAALKRFRDAEESLGRAGDGAASGFGKLSGAIERVTGPAGKVLQTFNEIGDVFRIGAFGLGVGAAFGGLEDIKNAMVAVYDAARRMLDPIETVGAALGIYRGQLSAAADAATALALAQEQAANSAIRAALSGAGFAGGSSAAISASNQLVATQEELRRLVELRQEIERNPAASGLTQAAQMEVDRLAALAEEARKNEREALSMRTSGMEGAWQRYTDEANALRNAALDFDRQAAYILDSQRLTAEQIDDLIGGAQNRIDDLEQSLRRLQGRPAGGSAAPVGSSPSRGASPAADAVDRRGMEASVLGGLGQNLAGLDAAAADERAAAWIQTTDAVSAALDELSYGFDVVTGGFAELYAEAEPLRDAWQEMGRSFDGFWDRMVESSVDAAGVVASAVNTMTTALGSMVTNLIIAGDAGADGVMKTAGNALAALSAQVFGYGIMLELMAGAALVAGPILGWSAPGLATAGAAMLGGAGALAVMARGLGADKIGGGGAGGRGRSGGASLAGSSPDSLARPGPAAPVSAHYTIVLDGAPIYDGMIEEDTRRARSGGSRQRLGAMA